MTSSGKGVVSSVSPDLLYISKNQNPPDAIIAAAGFIKPVSDINKVSGIMQTVKIKN